MNRVRCGRRFGAAFAFAFLVSATTAMAQSAPTTPLFAPVAAMGQALANDGIFLKLGYVEDLSSLVAGGQKTGTMPIGQLYAGVVFDLQTIMGIEGASIHIGFDERNGRPIDSIAGNPSGLLQSDAGPFKPRLSYFYWEQGFDHDRYDVILGRINPTEDFAFSDISCSFVGILCSQPTSWYFNNADVPYPSAAWGSRVNVQFTPDIYLRAGVYLHDSTAGEFQNHGFNWNFEHTQGAFLPVEIGYQTNFNNARYPAKYDLGFYEDTASYTQANGQLGERHAVWAQFEQAVWRPNPKTNQSVSVFGGALVYSGNSPNWGEYYLGAVERGPFASRPNDTIGLVADVIANSSAVRPNKPTQETFELNYGISVVPGVTVKPYTQYVIAPTNADSPVGSAQPKNAWVVGVQVAINFANLFSLPQFVAH